MPEVLLAILALAAFGFAAWREIEHRAERRELMQRIQAPKQAVIEAAPPLPPSPPPIIEDPERWQQEIERRRREELAQL